MTGNARAERKLRFALKDGGSATFSHEPRKVFRSGKGIAVLRGIERTFGLMGLFVIVGSVFLAAVTLPISLRALFLLAERLSSRSPCLDP